MSLFDIFLDELLTRVNVNIYMNHKQAPMSFLTCLCMNHEQASMSFLTDLCINCEQASMTLFDRSLYES